MNPNSQMLDFLQNKSLEFQEVKPKLSAFLALPLCSLFMVYQLGLDNLDALVMIYKNSFDDAWTDCKLVKEGITKYFLCRKQTT
jgi:hypothetical protein